MRMVMLASRRLTMIEVYHCRFVPTYSIVLERLGGVLRICFLVVVGVESD